MINNKNRFKNRIFKCNEYICQNLDERHCLLVSMTDQPARPFGEGIALGLSPTLRLLTDMLLNSYKLIFKNSLLFFCPHYFLE
jgi:hypothetical protein